MAFDWAEYLILAKELATRTSDEASLRSAVSRAYYAAFCTARNRLLQEGVAIPKTGKAHQIVWEEFIRSEKNRRAIGITGDRLFEIRKTCSLVGRTTAAGLQGRGSLSNQGRRECIWVSPNTMGEVDYEAIFKK